MHDICEEALNYDMCHIIYYLVNSKKLLSLDTLNVHILRFDYGSKESSNKPPTISGEASEMLQFVK